MRSLERLSPLDEDPVSGPHPCAHHDGSRRGQTQRTGTCNTQHRDGKLERHLKDGLWLSATHHLQRDEYANEAKLILDMLSLI